MMLSVARLYSVKLCDSGKDSEGRSHGLIEVLFRLFPVENEEHVRKYVVQKEGRTWGETGNVELLENR